MTDEVAGSDAVMLERIFEAPRELIWMMWTDPDHFKAWYGPEGATIPVANLDVRVGGRRHICMEIARPDRAMRMWFAGEHREVVENELLIYTEAISDEQGTVPSPSVPGPDGHQTTEVRVQLEEIGDRTRMVMTHFGVPPDSPGAVGWTMAFEKLAARLVEEPRT